MKLNTKRVVSGRLLDETQQETQYAEMVSIAAIKALLYEVSVTPKPGLVDRAGCGAHTDMDFFTFLDSSCALLPYFREITQCGMLFEGPPGEMLPALRPAGRRAEQAMFAATGGVNTHKGLIFSLGILCAALGFYRANAFSGGIDTLLNVCAEISRGLPRELEENAAGLSTAGIRAFHQYGLTGARGEAASGFASVRNYGHPVLGQMLARGYSCNDAGVITLLHLIAHVEDTNLVNRSNLQTFSELQTQIALVVRENSPDDLLALAATLDDVFVRQHLSPGGCADLLCISFFLWILEDSGLL